MSYTIDFYKKTDGDDVLIHEDVYFEGDLFQVFKMGEMVQLMDGYIYEVVGRISSVFDNNFWSKFDANLEKAPLSLGIKIKILVKYVR